MMISQDLNVWPKTDSTARWMQFALLNVGIMTEKTVLEAILLIINYTRLAREKEANNV